MNTYTSKQKEEAVALYLEVGTAEASRRLGIPKRTLLTWVGAKGLARARRQKTEAATAAVMEDARRRRAELKRRLLEAADTTLDRLAAEGVAARDQQSLAITLGILVDKLRLEEGLATGRTETVDLGSAERRIEAEIERLSAEMATQGGEPTLEPATEGAIGT